MSQRLLAKWSTSLKIVGAIEAITIAFLSLSKDSPQTLLYTPLTFLTLLSLGSVLKHSLKTYGLIVSISTVFLFSETMGDLSMNVNQLNVKALASILASVLLIIISFLLYFHKGTWKTFVVSSLLYLLLVFPLIWLAFFGFENYVHPILNLWASIENSPSFPTYASISLLGLIAFLMLSYSPGVKPFQSFRSVGLTYPSIILIYSASALLNQELSLNLTTMFPSNVTITFPPLLWLAVISLISIPLSLSSLKDRPLVLGLSLASASFAASALIFILSKLVFTSGYDYVIPLLLTSSGGSVIPRGITDPDKVKSRLISVLKQGNYGSARRYVNFLNSIGVTPTELVCQLSREGNCEASLWLASSYKVEYDSCGDLKALVNCILASGKFPRDVSQLLVALERRDRLTAEKLAGLVLAKTNDERTREMARRLISTRKVEERVDLPSLSNWDPSLWINRELYGYQVKSFVGKGGTAYVFLTERGGAKYAMKIPLLTASSNAERTRLSKSTFTDLAGESSKLQEISAKTDDMVTLYGIFVDRTTIKEILSGNLELYLKSPPAMVMEYMEGGDAESILSNQNVFHSAQWERIVAFILLKVAKALSVVHSEGYVHLDVKTKNVFFTSNPGSTGGEVLQSLLTGRVKVKLGDLGASRRVGGTIDQYTPEYCPVDQVEAMLNRGGASPKMDVFSLGATGYKLLTGRALNPVNVINLMDKAVEDYVEKRDYKQTLAQASLNYQRFYMTLSLKDVNQDLAKLIKEMVNPDPTRRPSAHQVVSALSSTLR
ncbi:MAG: protein kinase [Metallosphaera sp.]|uniref:protein kinase domain-containing protein n=1 Tax=Metallosphaera sp. TaxID=2020860 RepID=UPI00317797AA